MDRQGTAIDHQPGTLDPLDKLEVELCKVHDELSSQKFAISNQKEDLLRLESDMRTIRLAELLKYLPEPKCYAVRSRAGNEFDHGGDVRFDMVTLTNWGRHNIEVIFDVPIDRAELCAAFKNRYGLSADLYRSMRSYPPQVLEIKKQPETSLFLEKGFPSSTKGGYDQAV